MTQQQIPGRLGGRVSRPVGHTMSGLGLGDMGKWSEPLLCLFREGMQGHLEAQVQDHQTKT